MNASEWKLEMIENAQHYHNIINKRYNLIVSDRIVDKVIICEAW